MKLKDIESKIKAEQDSVKVPDMLSRVKKAPLNKLLSGETPAQAFKKELAVRLLVTATVLLIVAVFCFAAMLLFENGGEASPRCYISLRIQRGDATESYSVISSGDISSAVCINDATGERASFRAISALYALESTDKVSISSLCADNSVARDALSAFREELALTYPRFSLAAISIYVNSASDIQALRDRVSAFGVSPSSDLSTLIDQLAGLL